MSATWPLYFVIGYTLSVGSLTVFSVIGIVRAVMDTKGNKGEREKGDVQLSRSVSEKGVATATTYGATAASDIEYEVNVRACVCVWLCIALLCRVNVLCCCLGRGYYSVWWA
jgi:hypothetical protein